MSDIANAFIKAAADGRLSPDVAAQMVSAVGTLARVVEIDELKEWLIALEPAVGRKQEKKMAITKKLYQDLGSRERAIACCMALNRNDLTETAPLISLTVFFQPSSGYFTARTVDNT